MMLFLNFLITAVAYLFIPVILIFIGKKYTEQKIRKIIMINGIAIWIVFMVIRINAGIEGVSGAVILWSYIGYLLMKKKCLMQDDTAFDNNSNANIYYQKPKSDSGIQKEQDIPIISEKGQINCIKEKRKRRSVNIVITILTVLLVGAVVLNILQYKTNLEKQDELMIMQEQLIKEQAEPEYMIPDDYDKYKNFWKENQKKLLFYDENIVFVLEVDDACYYTYDQMMKMVEDYGGFTYWAYNKEQALDLGYTISPKYLSFEEYTELKMQ